MSSWQLLRFLLVLLFYASTNTSAGDITVSSGDSAFLPVSTGLPFLENSTYTRISFTWIKDNKGKLCQYYIDSNRSDVPDCNLNVTPRFKVTKDPLGITIINVESRDAGLYTCRMERIIPPPVLGKTTSVTLKVLSMTLQLVNSTNSSCVELLCSLQGLKPKQVYFEWTKANQLLHHETGNMSNILTLCKPKWTEGDTLMCHANYSNSHTLSMSVTLPSNSVDYNSSWLIIAVTSTCAGLLLLILLCIAIFKFKRRDASNGAVVYRNKIYENFTSTSATINPASIYPQNVHPVTGANQNRMRPITRSTPQTITQTQREECIYEN